MWNASIQLPLKLQRKGFRGPADAPFLPRTAELSAWHEVAPSLETSSSTTGMLTPLRLLTRQLNILHSAPFMLVFSLTPFALSDFDCSDPLGMESGEITSDQIMASSQYNPSWSPERSRLNYYENAWTPADDTNKEWIQVTLPQTCRSFDTPRKTVSWRQPQSHRLSDESLSGTTSVQKIHHRISVFPLLLRKYLPTQPQTSTITHVSVHIVCAKEADCSWCCRFQATAATFDCTVSSEEWEQESF